MNIYNLNVRRDSFSWYFRYCLLAYEWKFWFASSVLYQHKCPSFIPITKNLLHVRLCFKWKIFYFYYQISRSWCRHSCALFTFQKIFFFFIFAFSLKTSFLFSGVFSVYEVESWNTWVKWKHEICFYFYEQRKQNLIQKRNWLPAHSTIEMKIQ